MQSLENSKLPIIGSTEYVEVAGIKNIPAKIDTGADTSSIWASDIDMDYKAKIVRSSHGDTQVRYRVKLILKIGGESFETTFTLANRSRNNFPILIGRHSLEGRFLVDVSKSKIEHRHNPKTPRLNRELEEDPYRFHQKYVK